MYVLMYVCMEARTTYGRYPGWNDLREPHGNRDGSALHRRTVGEGTDGRTIRSVDGVRLKCMYVCMYVCMFVCMCSKSMDYNRVRLTILLVVS